MKKPLSAQSGEPDYVTTDNENTGVEKIWKACNCLFSNNLLYAGRGAAKGVHCELSQLGSRITPPQLDMITRCEWVQLEHRTLIRQ